MKQTKKLSAAACAVLLLSLASCTVKETTGPDVPLPAGQEFTATLEETEDTRVFVGEDFRMYWNASDRITLFAQTTVNQKYRFSGATGDRTGSFVKADGSSTPSALTTLIPHFIAIYPYNSSTSILDNETVRLTLPSEQEWADRSFGPGANVMAAVSGDTNLGFRNACGMLMLKIYGGRKVSSIMLRGNSGERISGQATITFASGGIPYLNMDTVSGTTIELICNDAVPTGYTAKDYTEFWIVVPPMTFQHGLTASVIDSDGNEYIQSTQRSITISRNRVSKMAPFCLGEALMPIPEAIDLGLPSGIKWASFNLGATVPEEEGNYYSWGETEPKSTYSWENYKWCNGDANSLTKYCFDPSYGYQGFTDMLYYLEPEDDAATCNLGKDWRMPTANEIQELIDNCTWTWQTVNGKKGYQVTGANGNSIFIPSTKTIPGNGYYWSSIVDLGFFSSPIGGANLSFGSSWKQIGGPHRASKETIRPVYTGDVPSVSSVSIDEGKITLYVGNRKQMQPLVMPADAANKEVYWQSSDYSVAYVSATGLIAAKSAGTATLTVTTYDGRKHASCSVTVKEIEAPDAIDLGLPSGTKWGSFNIGAGAPEEYGNYYAWGDTQTKDRYAGDTYRWYSDSRYTKYDVYSGENAADGLSMLQAEDDVATKELGGLWRMPTSEEINELLDACDIQPATLNGIAGHTLTGPNGNSIFIPCGGVKEYDSTSQVGESARLWSTDLREGEVWRSNFLLINNSYHYCSSYNRIFGLNVRPVYATYVQATSVSLNAYTLDMKVGDPSFKLQAKVSPSGYRGKLIWISSNPSVASVSGDGTVNVWTAGTATINVYTTNGLCAYCQVTVSEPSYMVPEAVDLGLSVKWASFNIGATSPEERGCYFAFGETEPKDHYDVDNYKWCTFDWDNGVRYTKYCGNSNWGTVDNKSQLDEEDDAAIVNLGGGWRMPTMEEEKDLQRLCEWTWTNCNGINGYQVKGPNGNSIFMPVSQIFNGVGDSKWEGACYWSSSMISITTSTDAYNIYFTEHEHSGSMGMGLWSAAVIRPVHP